MKISIRMKIAVRSFVPCIRIQVENAGTREEAREAIAKAGFSEVEWVIPKDWIRKLCAVRSRDCERTARL